MLNYFCLFLTVENYQTACQTSSYLSLESDIVQLPLQTEVNINSTAFDLAQFTFKVQPSQNECYQSSPSSSFNTKPGDISTVATNTHKLNDGPLMIEPAEELLPVIHIPEVGVG